MGHSPPSGGPQDDRPAEPRPDPRKALPENSGSTLGSAGKYAGLGLQFALSILLFAYLGQWIDRKLGTDGPFLLMGVFVGAGAAFYSIYRMLMADQRREDDDRKKGGKP